MSGAALFQLEGLRREQVERARAALAEAERAQRGCAAARQAAYADRARRETELLAAREHFARAGGIETLRWASTLIAAAEGTLVRQRALIARAERACVDAKARVLSLERQLREAELARRAVARTLARAEQQSVLRVERRLEDELDDLARARGRG